MSVTGNQVHMSEHSEGPFLGIKNANVFRSGRKSHVPNVPVDEMVNSALNKP
jgi:hypothetical protein